MNEYKKIISFENKNYIKYINEYTNDAINSLNILFNDLNNTLYEQKNKYDFYNIKNIKVFENILNNYYKLIENKLISNHNKIIYLETLVNFKNKLRNKLNDLQYQKRIYFKSIINEIGQKKYNLHSLNITLNIGEYFEKYIEKSYEDLQLEYIFDYVGIYENYTKIYINNLAVNYNNYKNRILNEFSILINSFLNSFKETISPFVDNNYIEEMNNNRSNCTGYSIKLLNQIIKEDEINYKKYLDYLNLVEYISSNCSNDNDSDNDYDNKTNYLDNCTINITDIEEVTYFNKTKQLLYCDKNNYFNFSLKIFENFDDDYKYKLNNIINNILINIDEKNFDDNLLNNYLKNEFLLNPYNLSEDDMPGDFEGFEDMIIYLNYSSNSLYKDYLKELLINFFKKSYDKYINNYLLEHVKNNINININTKLDFYTQYLIGKISNEFIYYIFLFNKTNEIGIGSFNAFTNLYKKNLYKNIKLYYEIIEEDALFYINMFYKKNRHMFKENYIYFFINKINDYNISIYGLNEFIDELLYDKDFNKSLNNISDDLMKNNIIKQLNETFLNSFNDKITQIDSIIDEYNTRIKDILLNININQDNLKINKIIMNYQDILYNQNNKFYFRISNDPFDLIYNFIDNELKPPLTKLKEQYNLIENEILESVSDSVNNFPDYIPIFKEMLNIDNIFNYINDLYSIISDLLLQYGDELDLDTTNYINKLIHYTYINGLYTYDEPCVYSFCKVNIDYNNTKRNLEFNKNYKKRKLIENERRNYDNLKKNKYIYYNNFIYDENMDSLSKDDIIYFLKDTKNIIEQLNKTFQINFDSKIKTKLQKYLTKTNITNLIKLKKTVSMAALKFSKFLSKESYNILEAQMLKQYYTLENYIFNYSNNLNDNIYDLIEKIKKSSSFFQNINCYIYDKILTLNDILTKIIENKYTKISPEERESYLGYLRKKHLSRKNNKDEKDDDDEDDYDKDFDISEEYKDFKELFLQLQKDHKTITSDFIDVAYQVKMTIFGKIKLDISSENIKKANQNQNQNQQENDDDDDE